MTTLTDLRTRVLYALGTTAGSTERGFDATAVDKHVTQAVEEFSLYVPIQAKGDITVTGGGRSFDLTTISRLIRAVAAEYPRDQWPRQMIDFDVWGNIITFDISPPAAGYAVRLYYHLAHLVDATSSTVEPEHEHVIVEGGAALAILARAMGAALTAETATVAPQTYQHLRVAQERLARWRAHLRRLSAEVSARSLYAPAAGPLGRDVVSWAD